MTRKPKWLHMWLRLTALAPAAVLLSPLSGCQESVVLAFYTGLEDLIISLVQTYFEAVTPTFASTVAQSLTWLT